MQNDTLLKKQTLLLILAGIVVNYAGVQLALFFGWPLFLDSIGTILCAALGGYLPGIIVGFTSNVINGASDPITLYYGILSIMIAAAATYFSCRRMFLSVKKALLAALAFALIGGGLGSVLTWLLYGFNFGTGISAPFSLLLHESLGMSKFAAQLSADMAVDIADKLITVAIVCFVLRFMPKRLKGSFHLGGLYSQKEDQTDTGRKAFRRYSLRTEVVLLTVISAVVLSVLAITIGFAIYTDTMNNRYISVCNSAVELMARTVDADSVQGYLEGREETEAYKKTERVLVGIKESMPDITYMYVYQIREDGCHVVFDLDSEELEGEPLGTFIPIDQSFMEWKDELLAGKPIDPIITNDTYGWLLTVYKPIYSANGVCVAYAAADIAMDNVVGDRYAFIIRMAALLFGAGIILVLITIWFAENRLVKPINAMTKAADEFAYESEKERVKSTSIVRGLAIKTGNELESLYKALDKTVTDIAEYITIISNMQSNIILNLAQMIESRDINTGEHVQHTAAYVGAIASAMRDKGMYPQELNREYVDNLEMCAPLHDVGKITVSDLILNKPGKLTDEEFEKMKLHTVAGRQMLEKNINELQTGQLFSTAVDMSAYHHERWDGKGYPCGLSGEDIPLCARIMAVADVFDALISKRSYKEPFSFEKARGIIIRESGEHFDPLVVEGFLAAYDKIIAIVRDKQE